MGQIKQKKPTRQPNWKVVKRALYHKKRGLNVTDIALVMKVDRKQIYRFLEYAKRDNLTS